ncbi:MAG: xanthine dehydrogenase accessory protein XdhC [Gammaproteobacteria bacterium]|nr:xanthine dehydrogenase accessory protein XdhC [Gammaproteobacteria bacterium]MCP4979500.1 xanthine dehydrogenase accessory protein XdhC [Gammaproteobacteria bacterium]
MTNWQSTVARLRQMQIPAVLVRVDSIVGSTPREPGARMIVTADHIYGTIGGGNLEYQASRIARNQLELGVGDGLQRFPLGAGLGQCCGGLVNLMFENLGRDSDWDNIACEDECIEIYLFGAGHVGQAVVRALQDLPVRIHWIDTRDDMLPTDTAPAVNTICTDTPEAEIDAAAAASYFLVMTHDHSLDQRLCEQILKRDDFTYFGLIGSLSKRRNFETRMRRRGVDAEKFQRMTCPIGIDGIGSKQPAQIAISVAAEILQVYDRAHNDKQSNNKAANTMGERA